VDSVLEGYNGETSLTLGRLYLIELQNNNKFAFFVFISTIKLLLVLSNQNGIKALDYDAILLYFWEKKVHRIIRQVNFGELGSSFMYGTQNINSIHKTIDSKINNKTKQ